MLTNILPSPNLDPPAAVAWYLKNPLLLAAYAEGIARRTVEVEDGNFNGPALHKLAVDLSVERNRLHCATPVEPEDKEAEADLRALLHSRHLTDAERRDLSYRMHTSRPSEYAWLRAPIEAAIRARADAAMLKIAAVAKRTNTQIIPASQLAAA